jgi:hypothetical protein
MLHYNREEVVRLTARIAVERLQRPARQYNKDHSITATHSVRLYRTLEIVTHMCKEVIVTTRKRKYTGILKGARAIQKTPIRITCLCRISGEEQWEVRIDTLELTEGIATVSLDQDSPAPLTMYA